MDKGLSASMQNPPRTCICNDGAGRHAPKRVCLCKTVRRRARKPGRAPPPATPGPGDTPQSAFVSANLFVSEQENRAAHLHPQRRGRATRPKARLSLQNSPSASTKTRRAHASATRGLGRHARTRAPIFAQSPVSERPNSAAHVHPQRRGLGDTPERVLPSLHNRLSASAQTPPHTCIRNDGAWATRPKSGMKAGRRAHAFALGWSMEGNLH